MQLQLKKNISILVLLAVIGVACKNSLNVQAPYKDVTVVYGLLDQSDSTHYIRINKGFEGNGNAYVMAQQYDSIYYPVGTINAVLQDSSIITNTVVKTIALDTTTMVPLGPGTFSYPKQLLYYTSATLNPNDYYNLIITNTNTGKKTTGSTGLFSNVALSGLYSKTFYLSFSNLSPTIIGWTTSPNARIYQLTIRFFYDEVTNSNIKTGRSIDWIFAPLTSPTLTGGALLQYSITAQGLCSLILNTIPYEEGVTRHVDSVGIIFTSGSDDLNTYVQLSQPPMGINQDVPSYSDVKNAVGLYTARHVQTAYKVLGGGLFDTLVVDPLYAKLNFQY